MENIIRIAIYSIVIASIILIMLLLHYTEKGKRLKEIRSEWVAYSFISSILCMIVIFIIGVVIFLM